MVPEDSSLDQPLKSLDNLGAPGGTTEGADQVNPEPDTSLPEASKPEINAGDSPEINNLRKRGAIRNKLKK